MLRLRQALEASWQSDTAYLGAEEAGNPSLGQCYPTARVVQHFFIESEIAEGEILTNKELEKHFWSVFNTQSHPLHVDFTWQQFPPGAEVKSWKIRDRSTLNDSVYTLGRVKLLLDRVEQYLRS